MKGIKKLLTVICLALVIQTGCSSGEQKKEQLIYNEVMTIHDEVMPKSETMFELKQKLLSQMGEIDTTNDIGRLSLIGLQNQVYLLDEADEAMMNWMRNFQRDQKDWSYDSVMRYLNREKESIIRVSDQINSAISETRNILQEYE